MGHTFSRVVVNTISDVSLAPGVTAATAPYQCSYNLRELPHLWPVANSLTLELPQSARMPELSKVL